MNDTMRRFGFVRGAALAAAAIYVYFFIAEALNNDAASNHASPATASAPDSAPAHVQSLATWPYLNDGTQSVLTVEEMMQANYYLVVDGSGSMSERKCSEGDTKLVAAKSAVANFSAAVPENANLGLVTFSNDGIKEKLALGLGNRLQFIKTINAIQAGGSTPLRTAIQLAYEHLTEQGRKQLGYGEYHLVVVTDGEANVGEDPAPAVNQITANSPVVIHTIGFCIGQDHSLNQPGRTSYQSATDPISLAKGLTNVLAEAPQFTVTDFK